MIDASTGDAAKLAKLVELENLRFEDGTTPDAIDTILTAHFAAEGLDRRDDAGTTNRLIYHSQFSDTAPDWLTAGDYTATFASSVTVATLSDFTFDSATHTWTYEGLAFPASGFTTSETITFTLTPDATKYPSATALTETLEATQGRDADGGLLLYL